MKQFVLSLCSLAFISQCFADQHFELQFERGRISTISKNAVVRGERDYYSFTASPGQRVSIAITSLEDNAVFRFQVRNDAKWVPIAKAQEIKVWFGILPKSDSGRYRIEIGGTRGNASYELFVGISGHNLPAAPKR